MAAVHHAPMLGDFAVAAPSFRAVNVSVPSRCRARTAGNELVTLLVLFQHLASSRNDHQENASVFSARLGSTVDTTNNVGM